MPPRGSLMLGIFRLVEDDHTLLVEVHTLAQRRDGIELRFRHFTADLVPWEKSAATALTLQSIDDKRAVFENSMNGDPKQAIFIRVDQDTYIWRSEVASDGGTMKVVDITFHRQEPPAAHTR
jgi:hypothetical protein